MLAELICTYCNKKWERNIYSSSNVTEFECPVCGDKHVKIKDLTIDKVDYYAGSPPFQDQEPTINWMEEMQQFGSD